MKLWLSSILFFVVFAFAQELAPVDNGFTGQGAPKQVSISVIEQSKANELFRKFVQNKEIPFKYPIDGCYARAHEMARMAEKEQVLMGKVFTEGNLQVKTNYQKYPIVQWGWHVAPIAYVKQPNGKTELMVFDPSLFGKPVTVEEWNQKMMDTTNGNKPEVRTSYYGARFQYFPKYEGFKKDWAQSDLEGVKATFKNYQPLQDLSSSATSRSGNLQQQAEGVR
jgi:hypothetical protein